MIALLDINNAYLSRLPEVFGVSRQTLYNWLAGETPKEAHQERLRQLVAAAAVFTEHGFRPTAAALDRTVSQGKSLLELLRDGANGSELMLSKKALREANAELERLAQTDALTGLANRRLLDRRLEEECSRAARHSIPLALVLIDVDYFKRVNDACGHAAGDECLKRIAVVLSSCSVRGSDVVARFGGEEFALLLPHTTREEAIEVAMRCVQAIDLASIAHPDSPIGPTVTISVGVASLEVGAGAISPSRLIRDADEALYRAKAQGRHQVQAAWGGNVMTSLEGRN